VVFKVLVTVVMYCLFIKESVSFEIW